MLDHVTVTITPTSDGASDYIQVMSDDYLSVNIVLVARSITVEDRRCEPTETAERGGE